MVCFLSSAKGDPIIRHSWFIAHWPEPLAERTSVMVASSKYSDVKTWQNRRVNASNSRENLLKEVTASGSPTKKETIDLVCWGLPFVMEPYHYAA
jgi:hypothetical protein